MSLACYFYVDFRLLFPLIHSLRFAAVDQMTTIYRSYVYMRESLPVVRCFVFAQSTLKSLSALRIFANKKKWNKKKKIIQLNKEA